MNTLVAPRVVSPCPQKQTTSEIDRAYVRLAAAIADVPDEIFLAVLMSKTSNLETNGSVTSH